MKTFAGVEPVKLLPTPQELLESTSVQVWRTRAAVVSTLNRTRRGSGLPAFDPVYLADSTAVDEMLGELAQRDLIMINQVAALLATGDLDQINREVLALIKVKQGEDVQVYRRRASSVLGDPKRLRDPKSTLPTRVSEPVAEINL
ncbi:hypothetical protein KBB08_02665 [Candidatus Gracilibacteria bacterium]|nr:hypothetical protein [Candidatus Gracilibacteria bacterium]